MGILLDVFLPLSLAIIMFSLGLGLTVADFLRVASQPKAFSVGAFNQIIVLPIIAFAIAIAFALPAELAVGLMILSFCPGGVTSNILTKLARGDVALSISLTGIISLLSIITVPFLVAWSVSHFMGADAPPVNIGSLALAMFLITTVPVALGIAVRHFASNSAIRIEPVFSRIAVVLFVIIVIGALAANWDVFVANLPTLGPAVIALNIVLLAVGWISGSLFKDNKAETTAIAIETGIQNATVAITVGSLIAEQASGLPPFSLPAGVYGITMYLVTLPFVFWRRRA